MRGHYTPRHNVGLLDAPPSFPEFRTGVLKDSKWHHITMVITPMEGLLFLDGVLNAEGKWTGQSSKVTSSRPLFIGRGDGDPFGPFKGSMDDIRVYNRALSAEEVKALYEFERVN